MFCRPLAPACLLLTLIAAGCVAPGMGGVSLNVPTSGGGTVRVEFNSKGIVHASNRDVEAEGVSMIPNPKAKTIRYTAGLVTTHPLGLRRVTIEDISDDVPATILVDEHPTLNAKREWRALGPVFTPDESNSRFLFQLENSVRIYRYTIVTDDGRTMVLEDGANFPAPAKAYFRIAMGLEKIDKR